MEESSVNEAGELRLCVKVALSNCKDLMSLLAYIRWIIMFKARHPGFMTRKVKNNSVVGNLFTFATCL